MANDRHTPGPWALNPSDVDAVGNLTVRGPAGWPVAETCGHPTERKANARLIAAAPDGFAALAALVAADNCNYQRDTMRHEGLFEAARAALEKAGL